MATSTAFATEEGPDRPRNPRDWLAGLADVAATQDVKPRPDLSDFDGWITVKDCVGPAFRAAPAGVN